MVIDQKSAFSHAVMRLLILLPGGDHEQLLRATHCVHLHVDVNWLAPQLLTHARNQITELRHTIANRVLRMLTLLNVVYNSVTSVTDGFVTVAGSFALALYIMFVQDNVPLRWVPGDIDFWTTNVASYNKVCDVLENVFPGAATTERKPRDYEQVGCANTMYVARGRPFLSLLFCLHPKARAS